MNMRYTVVLSIILLFFFNSCSKDSGTGESDDPQNVGKEDITLSLSPSELVFSSDGGQNTFMITSNSDWVISNTGEWCKVNQTSGQGDAKIAVSVDPYEEYSDRNTNLSIKAGNTTKILTVTQKKKDALLLTKDKYEILSTGGNIAVEVKSNIAYNVIIPDEYKDWIKQVIVSRSLEARNLNFEISANTNTDKRDGKIVFRANDTDLADTVYIYQAQKDELVLVKNICHVSSVGEIINVELRSNVDYDIIIPEDDKGWVEQVVGRSSRVDNLMFDIKANPTYENRSTKIAIKDKNSDLADTLYITQAQKSVFILSENEFDLPAIGGKVQVEFQSNVDFNILISEDAREWVWQEQSRAIQSRVLNFVIKENVSNDEREVQIIIQDKDATISDTIKIRQQGKCLSFKNLSFKYYLLKYYDKNKDNELTSDELKNVTELRISDVHLDSIQDLHFFPHLTRLLIYSCRLRYLDLKNSISLTELDCHNNYLSSLNVSTLPNLTKLNCSNNQLTNLDLSNCTSLISLNCSTNKLTSLDLNPLVYLTELNCSDNQLTNLDLSNCTSLVSLNCSINKLTSLDVNPLVYLTKLNCDGNQITFLNIDKNPLLELRCNGNLLTYLEINSSSLKTLYCGGNQLTDIVATNCSALTYIYCSKNQLSEFDIKSYPSLEILHCENNKITQLEISDCSTLKILNCSNNDLLFSVRLNNCSSLEIISCNKNSQLTELIVDNCPTLNNFGCFNDKCLTTLNIRNCVSLSYISWRNSQLISIDLSNCPNLPIDEIDFTRLKYLNLSGNQKIKNFSCSMGQLEYLDVSNSSSLAELYCFGNQLKELKINGCKKLSKLRCEGNQLVSLDLFDCTSLVRLDCTYNNLSTLDVSNCTLLTYLYADNNKLISLKIGGLQRLQVLYCYFNDLIELDLNNLSSLIALKCFNNQLECLDLSDCISLEELYCDNNQFTTLDVSNCISLTKLGCDRNSNLKTIYKKKGQDIFISAPGDVEIIEL